MQITASAISLTVEDVAASTGFFVDHLGFQEDIAADGFASLSRDDAGMNVIFMRRGIKVLPEAMREQRACGQIIAFTVVDLAGEERRLRAAGVPITLPLREEAWGERLFMVSDPNGIAVEFVEWAHTEAE